MGLELLKSKTGRTLIESHRGIEGAAKPESFADVPWWEVFQDPALQDLVNQALADNFDLRVAAARVEEARARAGGAKTYLFPELNVGGSSTDQQVSRTTEPPQDGGGGDRNFSNFELGFTLSWEIDIFGRIRRETESANASGR